jgi:hypothetical protein
LLCNGVSTCLLSMVLVPTSQCVESLSFPSASLSGAPVDPAASYRSSCHVRGIKYLRAKFVSVYPQSMQDWGAHCRRWLGVALCDSYGVVYLLARHRWCATAVRESAFRGTYENRRRSLRRHPGNSSPLTGRLSFARNSRRVLQRTTMLR